MKKILVVGGGLIGRRHVDAVRGHPRCQLVGLADPDPKTDIKGVRRFDDLCNVEEAVDGVIIATPTDLHSKHGIAAAARGWHMLVEKPIAGDLVQAKALAVAVERTGVFSLVGHHRRYHAPVRQLKSLVAEGAIGIPVAANLVWAMRKPTAYYERNWRTTGGSPVMINLVHDIDILRFVMGEITDTTGLSGARLRGPDRIESGAVAIRFKSGATATICFADTTPSPWGFEAATGENPNIGTTGQDMMWIMGTSGAISFPSMTLWRGTEWSEPAQQTQNEPARNEKPPLDTQLDHFVDVMEGKARALIDVADATRTLEVALQIEDRLSPVPV